MAVLEEAEGDMTISRGTESSVHPRGKRRRDADASHTWHGSGLRAGVSASGASVTPPDEGAAAYASGVHRTTQHVPAPASMSFPFQSPGLEWLQSQEAEDAGGPTGAYASRQGGLSLPVALSPAQREQMAHQILRAIGPAVYCFTPGGIVIYWTEAAERLFEYSEDEALGRHVCPLMCHGDASLAAGVRVINEHLSQGLPWTGQLLFRTRRGEPFQAVIMDTPLFDHAGSLWAIVGVAQPFSTFIRALPLLPPPPSATEVPEAYGRSVDETAVRSGDESGHRVAKRRLFIPTDEQDAAGARHRNVTESSQASAPAAPIFRASLDDLSSAIETEAVGIPGTHALRPTRSQEQGGQGRGKQELPPPLHRADSSSQGESSTSTVQPLAPSTPLNWGHPFAPSLSRTLSSDEDRLRLGQALGCASPGIPEAHLGLQEECEVRSRAEGCESGRDRERWQPCLYNPSHPRLPAVERPVHEANMFHACSDSDKGEAVMDRHGRVCLMDTAMAECREGFRSGGLPQWHPGSGCQLASGPPGAAGSFSKGDNGGVGEQGEGCICGGARETESEPLCGALAGAMGSAGQGQEKEQGNEQKQALERAQVEEQNQIFSEVMPETAAQASAGGAGGEAAVDGVPASGSSLWRLRWEDIQLGPRVGEGISGTVYKGLWRGVDVAVKVFSSASVSEAARREFRREVSIMEVLRHPNIVLYLGAVETSSKMCILSEFMPRGSLFRILRRASSHPLALPRIRRLRMAVDAAKGVHYLHSCSPPVVHHDLKSANLLVDKDWAVKVADFGLSKLKYAVHMSAKSGRGTPQWMAPEVLRSESSGEKADVFSFGVILWELATGRIPWEGLNAMQVVGAVGFMGQRLSIPEDVDSSMRDLILACWHSDPYARPSFGDILAQLKAMVADESRRPSGRTRSAQDEASATTRAQGSLLQVLKSPSEQGLE